ncbi:MAG: redox-sensing transcriptional repressor Rex [Gemmatimonadetes bacterium]|nr:redox-sensing transcriptional repressor Rex [Gemmatimonadota bacterium]
MRKISDSAVRRLTLYLRCLEELEGQGAETVSSADLARRGGVMPAQIRKDLSLFGSFGTRGRGYSVSGLACRLREILGLSRAWRLALVGAGRLGSALFAYDGFRRRGFEIVAVLDGDPAKVGRTWNGVVIQAVTELERVVRERAIDIVVLAVPAEPVEWLVDQAVRAGVRGVLNFAPTRVDVPEHVTLRDVDLVLELEALSFGLMRERA